MDAQAKGSTTPQAKAAQQEKQDRATIIKVLRAEIQKDFASLKSVWGSEIKKASEEAQAAPAAKRDVLEKHALSLRDKAKESATKLSAKIAQLEALDEDHDSAAERDFLVIIIGDLGKLHRAAVVQDRGLLGCVLGPHPIGEVAIRRGGHLDPVPAAGCARDPPTRGPWRSRADTGAASSAHKNRSGHGRGFGCQWGRRRSVATRTSQRVGAFPYTNEPPPRPRRGLVPFR